MKSRRIRLSLLFASALLFASQTAFSQQSGKPSCEDRVAKKSKVMQEKLGLSDQQYKEVYEINLAQAKAMKDVRKKGDCCSAKQAKECKGVKEGKCPKECPKGDAKACDGKAKCPSACAGINRQAADSIKGVYDAKIKKVLTPEQYEKWAKIKSQKCDAKGKGCCKGKPADKK